MSDAHPPSWLQRKLDTLLAVVSPRQRFSRDMWWNLASLGVLGFSGLSINLIIANYVGASALGAFNLVFAVYSFAAQIAVFGQHAATMSRVSRHQSSPTECGAIAVASVLVTLVVSVPTAGLLYLSRDLVASLFSSPDLGQGIAVAIPGLVLFPINKVLSNSLSAVRHMRAYAVLRALRYFAVIAFVVILLQTETPSALLPLAFTGSEVVLFLATTVYLHRSAFSLLCPWSRIREWIPEQISFGARAFPGDLVADAFARVDIFILGYFCADSIVGIYTFASTFAYGLSMIPDLVQKNLHALLGHYVAENDAVSISTIARRVRRVLLPLMIAVSLAAIAGYPLLLFLLSERADFLPSWLVFTLLMAGIALSSGRRPFLDLPLLTGHPGLFSNVLLVGLIMKVGASLVLIPRFTGNGAAIAASIAVVGLVMLNTIVVRRVLRIEI